MLPSLILLLFTLTACAPASLAANDSNSDSKRIILYPGGMSLVNIQGSTELDDGENTFTHYGLPSHHVDPASLSLLIDAEIKSQKYRQAGHGLYAMLHDLEGEKITLISSKGHEISGTLLSYQSGVAQLETDDDRIVTLQNIYDYQLVTDSDQTLPTNHPVATWSLYADQQDIYPYTLRYAMRGLSWKPEYELHVDEETEKLDVRLNAVLQNDTDTRFDQTDIVFMAGDIRLADTPHHRGDELMRAEMTHDISRVLAFEYYRYVLSGKHDIGRNETQTFPLEKADGLDAHQRYRGQLQSFGGRQDETRHFETGFVLQNTEEYGLGFLMPSGRISVYQKYKEGQELLGQDHIRQKAVGEEVFAKTGRSSDITWRERQVSMEQGRHGESLEEREITLINRSDRDVDVELALRIGSRDTLHETDMDYEELAARSYLFTVTIPANSEEVRTLKLMREEPRR